VSVRRHLIDTLACDFQLSIAEAADIADTDARHISRLLDEGILRTAGGEAGILSGDVHALDRRRVSAGDLITWIGCERRRLSALLDERSA
jgi:hypothetical protein